ncbi:MAG: phage antirepressor KilAC domain-containing protein [Flexilinea sp.]|nr:phage antirepressor KilAC domain-containing protein [Flexilinea sp.]
MNEITIFENPEFGELRVVEIDNEPWIIGKDICQYFGDTNHNRTLARVDDQDKQIVEIEDSMGRKQNVIAVNESGVYSILFSLQPQKANKNGVQDAYPIEIARRIEKLKRFKRWVTHDVLPSIRKHGMYAANELLDNPDFLLKVAQRLVDERDARLLAEAERDKLREENTIMLPKVQFADAVTASDTCILIGELAKILYQNGIEIGQNRLFKWMRDNGYLIKSGTSYNMPTQKAIEQGLFQIRESVRKNPGGDPIIYKVTMVTGKGQGFFINKFLYNKNNLALPAQI